MERVESWLEHRENPYEPFSAAWRVRELERHGIVDLRTCIVDYDERSLVLLYDDAPDGTRATMRRAITVASRRSGGLASVGVSGAALAITVALVVPPAVDVVFSLAARDASWAYVVSGVAILLVLTPGALLLTAGRSATEREILHHGLLLLLEEREARRGPPPAPLDSA